MYGYGNIAKCSVLFISCVTMWLIFSYPVTYLHIHLGFNDKFFCVLRIPPPKIVYKSIVPINVKPHSLTGHSGDLLV